MAFLFGLFTAWFVMAGALFIRDAKRSQLVPRVSYLLWPRMLWKLWLPVC